jgi:hypothetical protein
VGAEAALEDLVVEVVVVAAPAEAGKNYFKF